MKKALVRVVAMDALAKIQPSFAGGLGFFDSNKNPAIIYVDGKLPKEMPKGSYWTVLQHERGHELLFLAGIEKHLSPEDREEFCDLYSLVSAPDAGLTLLERELRKMLFPKWRWTRRADRQKLLRSITTRVGGSSAMCNAVWRAHLESNG